MSRFCECYDRCVIFLRTATFLAILLADIWHVRYQRISESQRAHLAILTIAAIGL